MKRIILLMLMLSWIHTSISAQENELMAYMMYSDNWTYVIRLSSSWTMMMDYGRQIGVDNFFVPNGSNPNNTSAAIMAYVGYGYSNIDTFVQADLNTFLQRYPTLRAEEMNMQIQNTERAHVIMYHIYSTNSQTQQYIAYISNDRGFQFAILIQFFRFDENLYNDFLEAATNSYVFPLILNVK